MREITRAPLQSLLSALGIALGVTAVVSVLIANHSARESFVAAIAAMEESATHSITGEVTDEIYRNIRLKAGYPSQPVAQGRVRIEGQTDESVTIYGIDPIAQYLFSDGMGVVSSASSNVNRLLVEPFSVLATADTLKSLALEVGESVRIRHRREEFELRVIGTLETTTPLEEQSLRSVFLTDIAVAQSVLDMRGRLSSIQLKLPPGDESIAVVENLLPLGTRLEGRVNRQRSIVSVTEAFQTNLTAMSLLALLVAIFLIYNTMTFLVMRRKKLIEILHALGVLHSRIHMCLLLEAALIGVSASIIGIVVGFGLSKTLLNLVERSIDNLYFPISAGLTVISPAVIVIALFLGIGSTLISTVPALFQVSKISSSFGRTRRRNPTSARKRALTLCALSGVFVTSGIAAIQLSQTSIVVGFVSIYLLVAGYFCLVPMLCDALGKGTRVLAKRLYGARGVLAGRALIMSGGRTSVAVCALCVAISATVGVGVMISSFRTAVDNWVGERLRADLYVSTSGYGGELNESEIDTLRTLRGVESVGVANWTWLEGQNGRSRVFAVDYGQYAFSGYSFKDRVPDLWVRFQTGGVIVSEPYSWKHDVGINDVLEFWKNDTVSRMPVLGVYYDYSSDRGIVTMHRDIYIENFEDETITSAALFTDGTSDVQDVRRAAEKELSSADITVFSARTMHTSVMEIFDQTFAITAVLRTLAIVVAFVAVASTLAMIQIDRERELRIQNALGFTPRQIWMSASVETAVMGLFSGVLSLPVGLILTWLLIWVVNQRSFGWTMQMLVDGRILANAVMLSVAAALIAGLIPAWRLARRVPGQVFEVE